MGPLTIFSKCQFWAHITLSMIFTCDTSPMFTTFFVASSDGDLPRTAGTHVGEPTIFSKWVSGAWIAKERIFSNLAHRHDLVL